ncbi:MAG: hypothetical protein AAFU85_24300 [Planctomycetota bacterium]
MKSPRKLALFLTVIVFASAPQLVGCTGANENTVVEQTPAEQTDADLEAYDDQMTQPGGI